MEMNSVHKAGLSVILFENLTDQFGFVIGRANKRYTLWKYVKEDRNGVPVMIIKYIQVLSDKRNKVEQRFPDIFICEELRGERRMELQGFARSKSGKWKPASAPKTLADFMSLPFGQFRGIDLKEVSDWYWCRLANGGYDLKWTDAWGEEFDFESIVMEKLTEHGCRKVAGEWFTTSQLDNSKKWVYLANTETNSEKKAEYDAECNRLGLTKLMGRWFPKVSLDEEKPWMTTARQILPLIENGESFSFIAHYNGNGFFFGVPIEFRPEDKCDVYTYYGSAHYLIITDKKGNRKNKRVKGKTIKVLEYEIMTDENDRPFVLVNKFDIK